MKMKRNGNSYCLFIPATMIKKHNIKGDQEFSVRFEDNSIIYKLETNVKSTDEIVNLIVKHCNECDITFTYESECQNFVKSFLHLNNIKVLNDISNNKMFKTIIEKVGKII